MTIDELCKLELTEVYKFISDIHDEISEPILRKARFVLEQLIEIGVGYLSLERAVGTLSGGESQRIKMARQLDCNLTDLLYILDEPSIGLHPRDTEKLISILYKIKEKGNSVFVVEHDPEIIKAAEWIIDLGPEAGRNGGNLVYNGQPEGLKETTSITGKYLFKSSKAEVSRRKPTEWFQLNNVSVNNLKNISVRIPKGVLTCITGVAGSGKSSLIHEYFAKKYSDAIMIDQSPVGKSSRANIATYVGVFDHIRKAFAAETKADASLFSFNSKGACPKCNGQGILTFELHFLDSVKTICDECEGKRYNAEVLNLTYNSRNIAEVLEMTVNQALEFFDIPIIKRHLKSLEQVGLGYLKLGQTLSTLSGGESQRLKIATELTKEGNIYIMDEPTTGLHMSDIDNFRKIINNLVEKGNSVIIIEHNLDIIKYADWIIDLGPEGGKNGGEILFEGTPEDLIKCDKSYTGKYLSKNLN
jgi:excinuclease UvrABC ATPase subunit